VLELGGHLLGRHELVLVEDHDRLGLEAPGIGVRFARLAGPDLLAVLVHLAAHAHDPAERLHAGDVEHDLVAGRDLLGHVAAALLGSDQPETVVARGPEVVERACEDPGLGGIGGHGSKVTPGFGG
jgi:hypothetical protein